MKLRRDVRDWVLKAEEDHEAVQALRRKRRPYLNNAVCFHAQQCVEKYLKALLTRDRTLFPKTHDLLDLLELAKLKSPILELLRPDLTYLQPYAVEFRYPGDSASRLEASRAARLASHIRNAIRPLLLLSA